MDKTCISSIKTAKNKSKQGINFSTFIFLMFFIMMMRGSYLKIEIYTTFFLMLIWIIVAYLGDTKSFIQAVSNKTVIWLFLFLTYSFILSIFSSVGIISSIGAIIDYLTLFIGILMFNYYDIKYDNKRFKKIIWSVLIIWTYFTIKALIFYNNNPYAGRVLISDYSLYGNVAIGEAYGLAFGSALIAVYLFSLLTAGILRSLRVKALTIFLIIILSYLVMETGSTITLAVLFVGFSIDVIVYLFRGKGESAVFRRIFWTFIIIVLVVGILLNIENIGTLLVNIGMGSDNILMKRLEIIGLKLLYGSSEGTLYVREGLYETSLKTFLYYPIFGCTFDFGFDLGFQQFLIGNHSELLDSLGRTGIAGSLPYFLIFFIAIKKERKQDGNQVSWAYVVVFILMFVFNPFHYPQSNFVLFFIISGISKIVVCKSMCIC